VTVEVTIGVMIAAELYGTGCSVVLVEADAWSAMTTASRLAVKADREGARILVLP
jgi:predicted Fe-S protein YdhL (DUF1289 family)